MLPETSIDQYWPNNAVQAFNKLYDKVIKTGGEERPIADLHLLQEKAKTKLEATAKAAEAALKADAAEKAHPLVSEFPDRVERVHNGNFYVRTKYGDPIVPALKKISAQWNPTEKVWTVPTSKESDLREILS